MPSDGFQIHNSYYYILFKVIFNTKIPAVLIIL
jgi:hypothetical protein